MRALSVEELNYVAGGEYRPGGNWETIYEAASVGELEWSTIDVNDNGDGSGTMNITLIRKGGIYSDGSNEYYFYTAEYREDALQDISEGLAAASLIAGLAGSAPAAGGLGLSAAIAALRSRRQRGMLRYGPFPNGTSDWVPY